MLKFLQKIRLSRRYKKHRAYLNRICSFGREFNRSTSYGNNLKQAFLNFNLKVRNQPRQCVSIGDYCNLSAKGMINERGSIRIGDYVYMNGVNLRIDHNLIIGSHCLFGPGVNLWDTNNHPLSVSERHAQCEYIAQKGLIDSYQAGGGDIIIEDDVWIGMDALILGPVRIGKGAVIAARSVVTKDVLSMTLVAGVPAKKVCDIPK